MKSESDIRAAWLAHLHSTEPADRPRAEAAVRRLYAAAGFPEPRHFIWYESPFEASWAVALLAAPHHFLWGQSMASTARSRDGKERMDRARSMLATKLGITDWNQITSAIGTPLGEYLLFPPNPAAMLKMKIFEERYGLDDDVAMKFATSVIETELFRVEEAFWGSNAGALRSAIHCPTTDQLIGQSFLGEYPFSQMAFDEALAGDREPPPIMRAAWDVARSAGLWWPFQNAAILSDRPTELHVNERKLLQNGDGPAAVYRDGWRVYAWNGKAVYERWIMEPESVPPRDLRGFDPTFRKFVEAKIGKPAAKSKKPAKPGSILKVALPTDHAARLEQLRSHTGGKLPLLDRYMAGDHRIVWTELVALGADVRSDPYAADALAVAYETMRRVETNVRTLIERLTTMGYAFTGSAGLEAAADERAESASRIDLNALLRSAGGARQLDENPHLAGLFNMLTRARDALAGQVAKAKEAPPRDMTPRPHVPPRATVRKAIVDFEKQVGAMPLSLRAFYEVVGEVNFIGHHPTLDPKRGSIATDPLVVYRFDEDLVNYVQDDDDEHDDGLTAIPIAPDDLHKADTSGGGPYEMAVPDPRADGELLNERHRLFFVDYLRLAFAFGGFPGYDGVATVPSEIATLRSGLIEF